MPDDVILGKVEVIERWLKRIREIHAGNPKNLTDDLLKQDAILLNLQRACQASIDLAMRIIRMKALGLPKESKDAFRLLEEGAILPSPLSLSLQKMVGFRNVAIHDYQELDLAIVESIIRDKLKDIEEFAAWALKV